MDPHIYNLKVLVASRWTRQNRLWKVTVPAIAPPGLCHTPLPAYFRASTPISHPQLSPIPSPPPSDAAAVALPRPTRRGDRPDGHTDGSGRQRAHGVGAAAVKQG